MLYLLVRVSSNPSSRISDDLHIVTRKYLYSPNPRLRKLGVLGAAALIHTETGDVVAAIDRVHRYLNSHVHL